MGRQELGNCIIMSEEDANKLGIKLRSLKKIHDFQTPFKSLFFSGERGLIRYIERSAEKEEADLAIITNKNYAVQERLSWEYSLYKYK